MPRILDAANADWRSLAHSKQPLSEISNPPATSGLPHFSTVSTGNETGPSQGMKRKEAPSGSGDMRSIMRTAMPEIVDLCDSD